MRVQKTTRLLSMIACLLAAFMVESAGKKFVIMTASYNNEQFYQWNLESVFNQTYTDWQMVYIDDVSTDGTGKKVQEYAKKRGFGHKVKVIINTEKCYCLKNYYREIHKVPDDRIIVTLDGDDALAGADVLSYLNGVYSNPDVWCTYGNYKEYPRPRRDHTKRLRPFPQSIVDGNKFREYRWNVHHLRSFYAGLFKNIKREDFMYSGSFFKVVEDVAYMLPILEQCGSHHRFIEKVMYLYNIGNPLLSINVWKDVERKAIMDYIYSKPKYKPLTHPPYLSTTKSR